MDVVICLHIKDLPVLRNSIPLLKKNLDAQRIYIITDKRNFKFIHSSSLLAQDVKLVDENTVVAGMTKDDVSNEVFKHFGDKKKAGWYFQQFLKLGFSLSSFCKSPYLVTPAVSFL